MTTLVHVELVEGRPDPESLGLITALRGAGHPVDAVLFGYELSEHVATVAAVGPDRILLADDPVFTQPSAAARVSTLMALVEANPTGYWLAATSTLTTEIAARLGARASAGIIWNLTDITPIDGVLHVSRLSGNDTIVADVTWSSAWGVGLFRSHSFDPVPAASGTAPPAVVHIDVCDSDEHGITVVEQPADDESSGPRLDAADVIVSAGRGIGDPAMLDSIRQLAHSLNGVAGVSLPLVELGWAPRAMQVGQTGTVVAPLLYLACGISGQIQHRVGMERSGTIIAINTDPDAPIMSFCDLAVVADVKSVVPRLIELLAERQRNPR